MPGLMPSGLQSLGVLSPLSWLLVAIESSGGFSKTPALVVKRAHAVTGVFISQEVA